jgi:integrase
MTHVFDSWSTAQLAEGFAPSTIATRSKVVRHAGRHAGVDPEDLTRDQVVAWLAHGKYAPATRCAYLAHLTAWATFIGRPEITTGIRRPHIPPAQPDPLPEQELEWLLRAVHGDDLMTAWILLGAFAGFRASETARLSSTDLRGDQLRVKGKRGRTDFLPVPPVLAAALLPFAGIAGPLWPGTQAGKVSKNIGRMARRLGLQSFRYHRLRHRYGTAVYRISHDLLMTQQLMRHDSPKTTAGYAAVGDDAGRLAVDQLPGSGSFTKE